MKLEVEYLRTVQYHSASSVSSRQPFTATASSQFNASKGYSTSNTIFSEYQKRVQLTGDVSYRLRVRLSNEESPHFPRGFPAGEWDLDIPFDLTMYMKLSGGQAHVGTVSSGLYFPPSPSEPSFQSHPLDTSSTAAKTTKDDQNTSNLDHSFFLRCYSLSFQNRTNLQSFPVCSAFTATRYPETQFRLEQELDSMKRWLHLKLSYSFHRLFKVIFDLESIRNYERIFSLIMKVSLFYGHSQ